MLIMKEYIARAKKEESVYHCGKCGGYCGIIPQLLYSRFEMIISQVECVIEDPF